MQTLAIPLPHAPHAADVITGGLNGLFRKCFAYEWEQNCRKRDEEKTKVKTNVKRLQKWCPSLLMSSLMNSCGDWFLKKYQRRASNKHVPLKASVVMWNVWDREMNVLDRERANKQMKACTDWQKNPVIFPPLEQNRQSLQSIGALKNHLRCVLIDHLATWCSQHEEGILALSLFDFVVAH